MNSNPETMRATRRACRAALGAALCLAGSALWAAPRTVEAFGDGRWASLQQELPRPAIVVFTTTDCAHCPAVIARIDRERRAHRPRAALVTVVMDAAPGDAALLSVPHYHVTDRLFAFDAAPERLRYAIDARWIGVTPYVALLGPAAPPRFVMGAPGAADWSALYGKP